MDRPRCSRSLTLWRRERGCSCCLCRPSPPRQPVVERAAPCRPRRHRTPPGHEQSEDAARGTPVRADSGSSPPPPPPGHPVSTIPVVVGVSSARSMLDTPSLAPATEKCARRPSPVFLSLRWQFGGSRAARFCCFGSLSGLPAPFFVRTTDYYTLRPGQVCNSVGPRSHKVGHKTPSHISQSAGGVRF